MENKPFRMFWGSSYDRGLFHLLKMWPQVLEKIPNAELHICYGWNLFDKGYANNPYMMNWKAEMVEMMKQQGITEYGRVSKEQLNEITAKCDIWAYYCTFSETNCITALNCQKLGVVPITMNRAGLMDTVYSGIKIEEDGDEPEAKGEYLKSLIYAYENPEWLEEEKIKAKAGIDKYYWDNIANEWSKLF
jgi:glycosyltransferase involved in cell wall biosynthesis